MHAFCWHIENEPVFFISFCNRSVHLWGFFAKWFTHSYCFFSSSVQLHLYYDVEINCDKLFSASFGCVYLSLRHSYHEELSWKPLVCNIIIYSYNHNRSFWAEAWKPDQFVTELNNTPHTQHGLNSFYFDTFHISHTYTMLIAYSVMCTKQKKLRLNMWLVHSDFHACITFIYTVDHFY